MAGKSKEQGKNTAVKHPKENKKIKSKQKVKKNLERKSLEIASMNGQRNEQRKNPL